LVIARFLGTQQIDFTMPSLTGLGDRDFARPEDLAEDVGNGRIWGGTTTVRRSRPGAGSPSRSPTRSSVITSRSRTTDDADQ
jgi:hypothetical protein